MFSVSKPTWIETPEDLAAVKKENARLREIANEIPGLMGLVADAETIPDIRLSTDYKNIIEITFNNAANKNIFYLLAECKNKTWEEDQTKISFHKQTWDDILVFLLLKKKLNELKEQEEENKKITLTDLSLSIRDSKTKDGVINIELPLEYGNLLITAINNKYGLWNEPYHKQETSPGKCTLSMYKRGLKKFLDSDRPALFAPINEIMDEYQGTSEWHPYYQSRLHGFKVLQETKQCLRDFLDDSGERFNNNDKEAVVKELHKTELAYPRWVEDTKTRKLVESSKLFMGFLPEVVALDTRIAERTNEYLKNLNAEDHAWFYTNESKRELCKHKINVLLEARACLYQDGYNGDLIEIENQNKRWIEGDYSGETRSLISDIKRQKGVSEEVIALDNRISNAINTYHKYIDNENSSLFSINRDRNIKLWKAKIAILTEAKNVIYSRAGSAERYDALLINHPDAWQTGSTTKGIAYQVKEFYGKRSEEDSKKYNIEI